MSNARETAVIDCRGLTAGQVFLATLPLYLEAQEQGIPPVIEVDHLELLGDSVARLLKSFDRLGETFGARVTLADRSGFGNAFSEALTGLAWVRME